MRFFGVAVAITTSAEALPDLIGELTQSLVRKPLTPLKEHFADLKKKNFEFDYEFDPSDMPEPESLLSKAKPKEKTYFN
jgi:hypothetical protein